MGEAFLDYAKELLQEGKFRQAYDMAILVSITDPFCPNVQQLLAIYGILLHHKPNTSSVNCYNVLGVPSSASGETIGLKFTALKNLVSSARDPSPISLSTSSIAIAAEAANTLLNFAFQVFSNETSRRDYDSRCNLPPRTADNNEKKMPVIPPPPPPQQAKMPHTKSEDNNNNKRLPPPTPQSKESSIRNNRVVHKRKNYRYDPINSGINSHHQMRGGA
ncbi:hypothetical protein LINGRAHAP2_LOCUS32373 [Linum grandiflorum]